MADDLIEDGEIVDDIFDVISSDDEDLRSIKDKMAFFEAQNKEIELIEHISQGKQLTFLEFGRFLAAGVYRREIVKNLKITIVSIKYEMSC